MEHRAERACLVIADISGYTGYLAGSELEHAQDVLTDLMETVVRSVRPVLRLAKFEGDAVFTYAPEDTLDASMLLDTVEGAFFTFQKRQRNIRQATTCQCNACVQIPTLTLKFVAHHGSLVRQRIMGREELAGTDVIVVHRLLKNTVTEALGLRGYALLSAACVEAMGIDAAATGIRPHRETYEHIGEVPAYVHDLEARWRAEQDSRRVFVAPDDAEVALDVLLPAPPPVVWEWMASPPRRVQWQAGADRVDQTIRGGRRGVGTTNHCVHGQEAIVEEVLDYRPFDYFTIQTAVPGGGLVFTYHLEPSAEGTVLHCRMQRIRSKKVREAWTVLGPQWEQSARVSIANLARLLEQESAVPEDASSRG